MKLKTQNSRVISIIKNDISLELMASLNEHTQDLDLRLTKHLLRRACFHYSKSDLDQYVGKTADEILNLLSSAKIFTMEWPTIQ